MRAGAGYVTACVPASLESIFEMRLLEVMTRGAARRRRRAHGGGVEDVARAARARRRARARPGLGPRRGAVAFARGLAARAPGRAACSTPTASTPTPGAWRTWRARERAHRADAARGRARRACSTPSDEVAAQRLATRARPPGAPARSSCSRATTRSSPSPTASSRSTPRRARPGDRRDRRRPRRRHRGAPGQRRRPVRRRLRRRAPPRRGGLLAAAPTGPTASSPATSSRCRRAGEPLAGGRRPRRRAVRDGARASGRRASTSARSSATSRACGASSRPAPRCAPSSRPTATATGRCRRAGRARAAGASWLAVATARRPRKLRAGGIEAPILVLGALTPSELTSRSRPAPTSSSGASACVAAVAARGGARGPRQARQRHGPPRHARPGAGDARRRGRGAAPGVHLAGAMTHFATADERGDAFFGEQLARFRRGRAAARRAPGLVLHAANSAATLRDPAAHFDLVRAGVAIYGLDPFGEDPAARDLEPALSSLLVAAVKAVRPARAPATGGASSRQRDAARDASRSATATAGAAR